MATIVFGLDGATFDILDPLMRDGVMPRLREFVAGGVRARLRSTPNPITPPAWTSMMTGRGPGHHGILDFIRADERPQGIFLRITDSRDIRVETLWSLASRQGRRIAALNFYGLWPPSPVDGYTIPAFVPGRHLRRASHPRDLIDRLSALDGFDYKELGMDLDEEKKAVQGMSPEHYDGWIRLHIRREQRWFEVLSWVQRTDPCHLTAIVFDGVDKIQHLCWRFVDPSLIPPDPTAWERRIRDLCLAYFRQIDELFDATLRLVGPDAQVYVVSDHGFGSTTDLVYINVFLAEQGWLRWSDDVPLDDGRGIMVQRMKNHVGMLDWGATRAYALTPSSNGIFIRGVPPDRYHAFRAEVIRALEDFRDPATGERVVTAIRTREEIFAGSAMSLAPDLTLTLRDGGMVSILKADAALRRRDEPAGTHRPEGIFVAGGPGIRRGVDLEPLSVLDVAPVLLHSIDLPTPADFEGRFPAEIFEPAHLARHPHRVGAPTRGPGEVPRRFASEQLDAADESVVADRLRRLGYLE